MEAGKIKIDDLKGLILEQLTTTNPDVLVGPKAGEDSAVIDFGEFVAVMSTDPITGVKEGMGSLAVNVACNDIAANGAEPIGIQQALLLPPETEEEEIIAIVEDIDNAAQNLGIDVLGGHTEVTDIVQQPLVSCTAIGKTTKDKFVTSSDAAVGDDIVVTKWTGLEGTSILATDFADKLAELGVGEEDLSLAQNLAADLSVVPEGMIGAKLGVNSMHDVTEGGLYGALYELTEAAEVGFEVTEEQIPVHPSTKLIATALEINPYHLIGSGMMILTTPHGDDLVAELKEKEVKSAKVGKIIADKKIIHRNGTSEELKKVPEDELWNVLADA
ncbi:MAG: AIR synthase family protein [Bacillota bacterium]